MRSGARARVMYGALHCGTARHFRCSAPGKRLRERAPRDSKSNTSITLRFCVLHPRLSATEGYLDGSGADLMDPQLWSVFGPHLVFLSCMSLSLSSALSLCLSAPRSLCRSVCVSVCLSLPLSPLLSPKLIFERHLRNGVEPIRAETFPHRVQWGQFKDNSQASTVVRTVPVENRTWPVQKKNLTTFAQTRPGP